VEGNIYVSSMPSMMFKLETLVVKLLFCIFKISNKLPYDHAARDLTSYWLLAVPIGKRFYIVIEFGHKNPILI
jgi:hypothetical protein